MRVWISGACLVPLLSGCLNLNLKQVLPEVSVYDLNTQTPPSNACSSSKKVALVGVVVADLYNSKDMIFKRMDGKIERSVRQKFADLPSNLLKNMFILESMRQCMALGVPSGARASVQLNVLSLGFVEGKDGTYAQIILRVVNSATANSFIVIKQQKVTLQTDAKTLDIPINAITALQNMASQALQEVALQIKTTL
ncbi:hypothetical protein [Helicobacter felis]|uniref:ABC-type transport auxiliary lipoprotein component domain-containing protein n=1 Tax=Helicobacter felis (strain ATCC 49179 / CCUG 28539 / NCTC 12436 / CS1) TaxID=936155 RepID=E7ACN2_HELFC|nr:hypothetical protein [Helicobacter felis]CBY83063.1 putative uncharacterized protein [Helicobacter felis ATCC 49179]